MQQQMYETQITVKGQKIGRYILEKRLGAGQFGTVWRARTEDTNEVFAIKKIRMDLINKSKDALNLLKTEIAIMHEINHPNILHLFEFIYSKKHYYLVVQFCDQGDFENYRKLKGVTSFDEPEAVYFLKQIMNGFMILRERKILHRDFKLANIFVHEERLVIGDFGFAKQGFDIVHTKLGTPLTMAPELLFTEDNEKITYTSKADLWSIGVVFYEILFGRLPFNGNSIQELRKNIKDVLAIGIPFPQPVSEEAKTLIRGLLTLDAKQRIEWTAFFEHPIFKSKQNSDVSKITLTFGQIGQMHASVINDEFKINMKKKNLDDNVNFVLNNQDFCKFEGKLEGKEITEMKIDKVTTAKLVGQTMAKEVNFRISHELNKVYFMIYFVHKIQKSLKYPELSSLATVGLNLSVIVLIKAKFMNNRIKQCIEKKVNTFKLSDIAMNHFYQSEYKEPLLNYVSLNEKGLSDHLVLLIKRCKENKLELTCRNVISKDVEETVINGAFVNQLNAFSQILPPDDFSDKGINRTVIMFKVIAKLIKDPVQAFHYLGENNQDSKFNWNRLYYILERVPIEELKNNL